MSTSEHIQGSESPHSISPGYIPSGDREALGWLEHFHATLLPRPSAFGVDPRDVESLGQHINAFRAWLALAESPDSRAAAKGALPCVPAEQEADQGEQSPSLGTPASAIAERDRARHKAVQKVQLLAGFIRNNPLTTPEDLRALHLPPDDD